MKRPLCCLCIAFAAVVFVFLSCNPGYGFVHPDEQEIISGFDTKNVLASGRVRNKEYKKDTLILYVDHISLGLDNSETVTDPAAYSIKDKDISLICRLDGDTKETKTGSNVVLSGMLDCFEKPSNPGGFDRELYYGIQDIVFELKSPVIVSNDGECSAYRERLCQIRRFLEKALDSAMLDSSDAAILKAMLLGNKSDMEAETKSLYQKSGISHIFAISGLHITFLGMGLYRLLGALGCSRLISGILCILMMTAYGDMTGMSASAYRAIVMFSLKIISQFFHKSYDMLTAMSVSAILLLLDKPYYIKYTGFLLSFGAIIGIGCMAELLKPDAEYICQSLIRYIKRLHLVCFWGVKSQKRLKRAVKALSDAVGCGLGVLIIHFPIMLESFHKFSIYSFFLNLIVIPAMQAVLILGVIILFTGSLSLMSGAGILRLLTCIPALLCHLFLKLFEKLSMFSLNLPGAVWTAGCPDSIRSLIFYLIVLALWAMHTYVGRQSRKRACCENNMRICLPWHIRMALILVGMLCITGRNYDGLGIVFLDVGQGDCIWIENDNGNHYMIDGGSVSKKNVAKYDIVPFMEYMGDTVIDAVFLTHLDSDHISGVMELIGEGNSTPGNSITIKRIIIPGAAIRDEAYESLLESCNEKNIPVVEAKTMDAIADGNLRFEALHPDKDYAAESRNAYSLVLKMEYTDRSGHLFGALFTGDVEPDGERKVIEELSDDDWNCNLYKAAHHGSKNSNTRELLEYIRPDIAVISCGASNRYGHPHRETLDRLENTGSRVFRTDKSGAVMINVRKGKVEISGWRG